MGESIQKSWMYYHNQDDLSVPVYNWSILYPIADGKRQSPINITLNDDNVAKTTCYTEQLELYYKSDDVIRVKNTGKSVEFDCSGKSSLTGGPLGANRYTLLQFHFHWGSDNIHGSEHLLNGRAYAAEVHFVHKNDKYKDFQSAINEPDGLCVIGAFLNVKECEHNVAYEQIVQLIGNVKESGKKFDVSESLDLRALLPCNIQNFSFYEGSLTTPPLSQCVLWVNMVDAVTISDSQISAFRRLINSSGYPLSNNYRPIQSLFGRHICHNQDC